MLPEGGCDDLGRKGESHGDETGTSRTTHCDGSWRSPALSPMPMVIRMARCSGFDL